MSKIIKAFLFINQDGGLRVTKRDYNAYPNELGMILKIEVPDSFFRRPIPEIVVTLPDFFLEPPKGTQLAKLVAEPVAEALKLDVERVQDGLAKMLEDKELKEND